MTMNKKENCLKGKLKIKLFFALSLIVLNGITEITKTGFNKSHTNLFIIQYG